MAAQYIFGSKKISGAVSKLSGTTKGLASGILSDPRRMESIINVVRTAAPLTSAQTVNKINTYLPGLEKMSTLLGMYSFLSRAQNYNPIQPLGGKTMVDKVGAMMKSGNIPVAKLMAQPLIANNMDKIMATVAKDIMKSGNLNEMLSTMAKQFSKNDTSEETDGDNMDLSNLIETFMPLISNMSNDSSTQSDLHDDYSPEKSIEYEQPKYDQKVNKHEAVEKHQGSKMTTEKNEPQKNTPIRIRQRKRRTL